MKNVGFIKRVNKLAGMLNPRLPTVSVANNINDLDRTCTIGFVINTGGDEFKKDLPTGVSQNKTII